MSQNRKSWKKVSSRRAKLWKKFNGEYTPVTPPMKIMLLVTIILMVILIGAFGYYQNDVTPYLPKKTTPIFQCSPGTGMGANSIRPNCVQSPDAQIPDPFSTLFDGRINGITQNTPSGGWGPIQFIQSVSSGSCTIASGVCSVTTTPLRQADDLVVVAWATIQCQNNYDSIYSDPSFGNSVGASTPCLSLSDTQGKSIVFDACSPRFMRDGTATTLAQYYECIFRIENVNAFSTEQVTATKQGTIVSTGQSIMGLTVMEYEGISNAAVYILGGDANGLLFKNVGSSTQYSTSLGLHPPPTAGSVSLDPSVTVCNNLNGKVTGCFHSNTIDYYRSITIYTNGTIVLDVRGDELQSPNSQVSNHITTYGNGTFDIQFQATQPSLVTSSNAKNGTPLYANGIEDIQYTTNQVSDLVLTFITQTNLNLPLTPLTGFTFEVGSNTDAQVKGPSGCNEGSWSAPVITRTTTGYLSCELSIGDDFSLALPIIYNSFLFNQTTTSMLIVHYQTNGLPTCGRSYMCSFAQVTSGGEFQLYPTSINPGVVMSNSTIDLSTAINRALAFNEVAASCNPTNNLCSGGNFAYYTGEMFGFFMRLNSTLPSEAGWSPLNDPSVSMLVMYYVQSPGTGDNNAVINLYVYIQRQLGSLLSVGNLNPINDCTTESTLYFCHGTTQNNHPSLMASVLNFSGGAINQPISNTNGNSRSYFCTDWGTGNNPGGCILGGAGSSSITYANTNVWNVTNVPWLNLQGAYHIGMWMAPNSVSGSQDWTSFFQTSASFDNGNIISIYYPPAQITKANSDNSFLGWLGHTFGGVVNSVGNAFRAAGATISNAGSWLQNTALGPIGDVLQGMVSWMVTQVVSFLNWVGSGFGFPTLGTSLLNLFTDLATIVTQVLLNFVSWVTSTGTFILKTLTFVVNIFANAIIFGLLAFVYGPLLTLLSIVLTIVTLFFSAATPTSYLLMMDWIWGILMVYVIGVSGFLWWTDLNTQIFTFVFKMIWKFTELIWRVIVIIKSFIPTEGGTPADLKDPTPGSGPKGGSGSGGKPDVKKEEIKKEGGKSGGFKVPSRGYGQGAKDGDPIAILIMGFMIVVLLYWLSQAAFSPISNVNVVGCIAWSTNCHVQNGVTVGTINTSVFFAYLFDQGHGVRIIFTLFIPLLVIMFAYWFMKNVVGEDKARGNDFLNIGGTVGRTAQRTGERTTMSRRETMRRYRKNRGEE